MTETLVITPQTANVSICLLQCPVGKEIRIISVIGGWAQGDTGERLELSFLRSGLSYASSWSSVNLDEAGVFSAFHGAIPDPAPANNIDPVTGGVTWLLSQVAQIPIPDIWYPFDIKVTVAGLNAAAGTIQFVLYERRDRV